MTTTVIKIENLSKYYRLGLIGSGTLREDVGRWIAKIRGQPDPLLKIGEQDHGNRKGGQIWALKDISIEVKEGEILGIIGRNGAGKSTLLKILSKITAPTEGKIKIIGRVGSLLEVGTGFHPELTGRENIYLNGTILGMSHAEVTSKLDEIVDFAEMDKFIDTPVKRYSSGMTVKLAFSVAAHLEPEILVVDEVLAVGDAAFQKKCMGKMSEVAQNGRTILFVSHNMGSINRLCTRCVSLEQGQLKYEGAPSEVVSSYLSKGALEKGKSIWITDLDSDSDPVQLYKVSVTNSKGKVVETVRSDEIILIKFELTVRYVLPEFGLSIKILSSDGTTVIHTANILGSSKMAPGKWVTQCEIPSNSLNTGSYTVNVAADIPHREILFDLNDILSFQVLGVSENIGRYPASTWKGVLSPDFSNWKEWECIPDVNGQ